MKLYSSTLNSSLVLKAQYGANEELVDLIQKDGHVTEYHDHLFESNQQVLHSLHIEL